MEMHVQMFRASCIEQVATSFKGQPVKISREFFSIQAEAFIL
jgi:hypothetical protein